MKSMLLLPLFLLNLVVAQNDDNIDDLINKIFPKPTQSPVATTNLQPTNPIPGTSSCECVPYYLCNNGTINRDGTDIIDIRVQEGPCHYLSVCCGAEDKIDPDDPKITDPNPKQPIVKPKGCGLRNPDGIGFRIKGDKDNEAQFGEFPWMTAVLREETLDNKKMIIYKCGGSLIHPQVVLTAAHCVTDKSKHYKIRAGEWDTQTQDELLAFQDRDVTNIISHPEFYKGGLFNDIAVLILDKPFEIAGNVDTVCLPSLGTVVQNTRCVASGWGKDVFGKEGQYQVIMKKVELPIVARDTCQAQLSATRLGRHFQLHSSFICAGGEPGKDTCKGDGGSPLVCPLPGQPGKYFQAGIVAWGIGCGENQVPGVYTNVAKFADWIDQQIMAHNFEKSYYTAN